MIRFQDKESPIQLDPLQESDLLWFYDMATNSDGSKYWYGSHTGYKTPNLLDFKNDYTNVYFDNSILNLGQCFSILLQNERIGVIIYNKIEQIKEIKQTEIDIIIGAKQHMGKGYGIQAINLLCQYLLNLKIVEQVFLEVPVTNVRAYYAYKKAKFNDVKRIVKVGKIWIRMKRKLWV